MIDVKFRVVTVELLNARFYYFWRIAMDENIEQISDEFFSHFGNTHVLLYVGQDASVDEIKAISKGRWSAIITTNTSQKFASYFANEMRNLQICTAREELSTRFLSEKKPLLIRLYGVDGEGRDEDGGSPASPFGDGSRRKLRNAEKLLSMLPALLDYVNSLVVTGIGSDDDIALLEQLGDILKNEVTPGSVSFWGTKEAFNGKEQYGNWLRNICEQKSLPFYETTLAHVFENRAEDDLIAVESPAPDSSNDVFFCNRKPVSIKQNDLLRVKNAGYLLTERTIYRVTPRGRHQRKAWFSNFLELSGIGEPQWYGYLLQSDFHVKREYEDALVHLVRRALKGCDLGGESLENQPIVLSGDPGSSKSVTLGALAYRIYSDRDHPVLFISDEAFLGSNYGSSYRNLIDALETIQEYSESGSSILVVWDGSSYREIEADAKNLLKNLKNRGRNIVLVCSSYSLVNENESMSCYSYEKESDRLVRCQEFEKAVVFPQSGCIFVNADRRMTDEERDQFWERANDFSGIPHQQIGFLKARLNDDGDTDIFNHYYHLVSLLRERLENSLEGEQDKVTRFLQEERPNYFKKVIERRDAEQELSPIWQAFLEAGMTSEQLREIAQELEQPEMSDDWSERLVRANAYIALFSKYKIDVPYGFVYEIITKGSGENPYGETGRELFDILTTRIPWLACGETNEEEFVFRFRNSLEASIFLAKHKIEGKRLMGMTVDALRLYGESCQNNQYDDPRLAQKLQALIRLIGPNSKFHEAGGQNHRDIQVHLDILIDAIYALLNEDRIPDSDCGFALLFVTLTREFYGRNVWDSAHGRRGDFEIDYSAVGFTAEAYETRLEKISFASAYALECAQKLEAMIAADRPNPQNEHLRRQISSLVVESTRCNLELDELCSQYQKCCKETGHGIDLKLINASQPYPIQFRMLAETIQREPLNGYAYNALFSVFEKTYQSNDCSDELKIEYLMEILPFVDACTTYSTGIENRGARRDELSDHLNRIGLFADEVPVTIDTIESQGNAVDTHDASMFIDIYNKFLEQENPAAILFLCQKEISQLGTKETMSDAEVARCQRVLDFMKEPTRFKCISSKSDALAFLIRITWLAFNKSRLSETREYQTTALTEPQWRELYRCCKAYSDLTPSSSQQPLLNLVYALSALQVGGCDMNSYSAAYSIIQQIDENQFGSQYRMKTPFIVCDEHGEPLHYTGTVVYVKGYSGFMSVSGMPRRYGNTDGVRFRQFNFGRNFQMPEIGEVMSELELGVGYTGFSLFKEQGRKELGRRQR